MTATTLSDGILVEKPRISSIDVMRGAVMVIMALDHVRDFFHADAQAFDPTDLTRTYPALFFTRWITHFCAPTFVFLAGTSIRLSAARKSTKDLSVFLLTRGLWLLLLEVTIIRFSFFFQLYYDVTVFQVISAIGASMIIMAALIHLPKQFILAFGVIITFGHNLLDGIRLQPGDTGFWPYSFLYQFGFFEMAPGKNALIIYPLLPWFGVMLLGYSLGDWYIKGFDALKRKKYLLITGVTAIALFVVLRLINSYGDQAPWSVQKNAVFTVMSFLNVTKYPASLMYYLMTLGPVLVILSFMEKSSGKAASILTVFGRVPLFYYVLHFYIVHITGLGVQQFLAGKGLFDADLHFPQTFGGIVAGGGVSLGWTYVAWILIVLALYPVCRWYNNYKQTHQHWWLSYL